jgi:branched-chain amino acid aminotransferase
MIPACWVNGRRVDADAANLLVSERGFMFADGLFETMRAFRGVIFRLQSHLERLAVTADRMQLVCPERLPHLIAEMVDELEAGGLDAAVRLTVTRGTVAGLAPPSGSQSVTVVLVAQPVPHFDPRIYHAGLTVRIATGRRNEFSMSAGMKTLNYTDSILALLEAREVGADEALFLDTQGHVSEASASNVFVVVGGEVLTPPLTCGALPGITRDVVFELLGERNMRLLDRPISTDELESAEEVFLTSSLRGIAPVASIDGHPVGAAGAAPGPVTRAMMDAYAARVLQECVR